MSGDVPSEADGGPLPIRPMGLGEILDGAFRLLRADFGALLLAVGAVIVPTQLLLYAVSADASLSLQDVSGGAFGDPATAPADLDRYLQQLSVTLPQVVGASLLQSALLLLAVGAVTHISAQRYLGGSAGAGEGLTVVARRAVPLLVGRLLALLAVWVPLVAAMAVVALGAAIGSGAAVAVGVLLVLAAIPLAIWLYVRFALLVPAVVVEGAGPVEALRRSTQLVLGRWWPVFGTLVVAAIVLALINFALSTVPTALAALLGGGELSLVVSSLAAAIAALITQPVGALIVLLLYFDNRIRREGFDLQLRQDDGSLSG